MKRFATVLVAVLALALIQRAARADSNSKQGPLTGTWECNSHGGSQGDLPFTLELEQNGQDVSGSVSSPMGGTEISSASFKNNVLEIHIDTDNVNYTLTGKLAGDKLNGQWSTDGNEKGTWEGKRSKDNGAANTAH
jgi:hypothetical protein